MKNYDEIAQNLFERRDEYLKEQKSKKAKLKKRIIGTACVFAVALAGFGVWKSGILSDKPKIEAPVSETAEGKSEQQENTTKAVKKTTEPASEKSKENQKATFADECRKTGG